MLEKYLVLHCSPTLASLKPASLFSLPFVQECLLNRQVDEWNHCLGGKGVSLTCLKTTDRSALIYVFRRSHLKRELDRPEIRKFLGKYGYSNFNPDEALCHLRRRLAQSSAFPHEIGIFLGYPLDDVVGFIKNNGQNCKCSDCWKVYGDECEAKKMFAKLKKCKEQYVNLWMKGKKSIWQLTVAA